MPLESATYISDLVASNPLATDGVSVGDDHIRLIKNVTKATFPNVTGAVTPTHTVLNYMLGVTSAVQTQIDAKVTAASPTLTGVPIAPTAAVDTNTTQLATTAYVVAQAASATPLVEGTAAVGTSKRYARADHVHPAATTSQTWQSVTRTQGVGYTNSTGQTINFHIEAVPDTSYAYLYIVVGGITLKATASASAAVASTKATIPPGASYSWNISAGTVSSVATYELR